MKTNVISKEYLENQYLDNQKSMKAIAVELGYSPMYIRKWLMKYEIPIKTQNQYARDLDWRKRMSNAKLRIGNWSGENNPNWKGGVSKEKHGERSTGTLKSWRHWVRVRDDWVCQKCGIDGKIPCSHCGVKPRLHADHIKPWKDYPELRFEISNGRTLCEDCHIRNKSGELLESLTAKGEGNQQPSKT
jgi:5-methylcytosine-specific restriction endonuclease McrA